MRRPPWIPFAGKVTIFRVHLVLLTAVIGMATACSSDPESIYYVANDGHDDNPGTLRQPFQSIQKAAEAMKPGDICYIRRGTYREVVQPVISGLPGKPVRFQAYRDEKVALDGTDRVEGDWELYTGKIYKTRVAEEIEQLFCDGMMMVEARWPDMSFPDQLWDRGCWAASGEGSRYGKMVNLGMASTGIDWTGGIAVLNVAHQFRTWTRKVLDHESGSNTFTYHKDLQPITHYADKTRQWEDDCFYLFGKLEALDAPGEWFLDAEAMELYFLCPGGGDPAAHEIAYKARDYTFVVKGKDNIEISGIEFFNCTFRFEGCNECLIENCTLEYPTFSREFNDPSAEKEPAETIISGDRNTFRNNFLIYAQLTGIVITGSYNLVENNIIRDVAWPGQGFAVALISNGDGNMITRNTLFNTGYSALVPTGQGKWEVSYNHLHHSALLAKDCAVIQTGGWSITGSVIHHNWVHDCYATGNHPGGLKGGLGIRGDDQTRGLTVHHNVVWNCGRDGIIVKGDTNRVYNNTVFHIGSNGLEGNYISMHTEPEPFKPWRQQAPLLETQNLNSMVINNASMNISGDRERGPFTPGDNLVTNYLGKDLMLRDPGNYDFTPVKGSPLIDAGTHIPGFTDGYKGKAPDIGAYEAGDPWKAGTDWEPDQ